MDPTDPTRDDRTGPHRQHRRRLRIGDAEREAMLATLQEHLGAGRLDMAEYERRVEQATAAVYTDDLDGLLDDLPPADAEDDGAAQRRGWRRPAEDDGVWGFGGTGARDGRSRPPWERWTRWGGLPKPLVIGLLIAVVIALPGHAFFFLGPLLFFAFVGGAGRGMFGGCHSRHAQQWRRGHPHHAHADDHPGSGSVRV